MTPARPRPLGKVFSIWNSITTYYSMKLVYLHNNYEKSQVEDAERKTALGGRAAGKELSGALDLTPEVSAEKNGDGHERGLDGESGEIGGESLLTEALEAGLAAGEGEEGENAGVEEMREETGNPSADADAGFALRVGAEVVVDAVVDARADDGCDDAGDEDAAGETEGVGDVDLVGGGRGGEKAGEAQEEETDGVDEAAPEHDAVGVAAVEELHEHVGDDVGDGE